MDMSKSKKEATKERIIDAALFLFQEKGFDETTVKEITDKAQVAKGTFFNYFPIKESILGTIALDRLNNTSSFLDDPQFKELSLLKQIRSYLEYLLVDIETYPELTRKMWIHAIQTEHTLLDYWRILLKNAIEKGEIAQSIDITQWSQVINSHFHYALFMFIDETSLQTFITKTLTLIYTCTKAITEKRGNFSMQKLVLLGGGYGNMRILQRLLASELPKDLDITLIDRLPYHCLKTEYYALAAGTESDHHLRVSFPVDPRLKITYGNIESIDIASKQVLLDEGEKVPYDTLIIGLGCEDKYHNVPGAPENTFSIQSMEATRRTYEALNNVRPEGVVSIVGAGLSGVELASELRESRPDLTIKLFDRGEIILSMFPRRLSNYVQNWFIDHGVEVINKSNITKVEEGILYNHHQPVESDAIIWTAGIQPVKVVRDIDVDKDEQGRVKLTKHHHLPTDENVFVVGDCASLSNAPSAQLAEGQGEQIVMILRKRWNNEELPEEMPVIKLKGVLGSLGKKHGFGLMGERTLLGRMPRFLKSGVLWMYKYHSG